MYKKLVIALIVLWIALIAISAVNMFNQYQVSQHNFKILKSYQLKSEVPPMFTTVIDSLNREIATAEAMTKSLVKPFPIKDPHWNWLFLRISIVLLAVVTFILIWKHYKKGLTE
jgi:hypothetical protein